LLKGAGSGKRAGEFVLCSFILPLLLLGVLWYPLRLFGLGTSADFIWFYAAGKVLTGGAAAHLYDPPVLFNHPPFEALLFAPLAYFSYSTAFLIWTLVSLSLLGSTFFLLRMYGVTFTLSDRLILIGAGFYPVLAVLIQGQDSLWVLMAYVLAFFALKREEESWAGCMLAIGLLKPQLVVPFVFIQALRGRWKFIAGFSAAGCLLLLLSLLLVGPATLAHYAAMPFQMTEKEGLRTFYIFPSTMPNLRGLLYIFFGEFVSPAALGVGTVVLSLGLVGWAASVQKNAAAFDLDFGLSIAVTMLVSFHLLLHDLSLLILPVFLALNFLRAHSITWSRRGILVLAPVFALFVALFAMQMANAKEFAPVGLMVLAFAWGLCRLMRTESCVEGSSVPSVSVGPR
jgi:hypothetical protein